MTTYNWTLTVADTGAPPYGYDNTTLTELGSMVPDPPIVTFPDGNAQILGINDYGAASGIEMYLNSSFIGATRTIAFEEIESIDISHSGGTLHLNTIDTGSGGDLQHSAGYENSGETYYWWPDVGGKWLVGDVAQEYNVGINTAFGGYDQGTVIVNPKNPGGGVLMSNAARTTTTSARVTKSPNQGGGGKGGRGGKGAGGGEVILDLPTQAGTFDLTCHVEGYDFGSETWYAILSGANVTTGNTKQRLKVAPFVNDVANVSANDLLPYLWRVRVEHGDATEVTYSVEYRLV